MNRTSYGILGGTLQFQFAPHFSRLTQKQSPEKSLLLSLYNMPSLRSPRT